MHHRINHHPEADADLDGLPVGIIKAPYRYIRDRLGDHLPGRECRRSDARWFVESWEGGRRCCGTIENDGNGPRCNPDVASHEAVREWRVYSLTAGFISAVEGLLDLEVMAETRSASRRNYEEEA